MSIRHSLCCAVLLSAATTTHAKGRVPEPLPIAFQGFEDDAGGMYLVWSDDSLLARHLDSAGRDLWSSTGLVVTSRLTPQPHWDGLADGTGGLTLFWAAPDGIRAQRFNANGTRRRPGESVLMSTHSVVAPDAVADAQKGTYVIWDQSESGRDALRLQRIDQDGKRAWAPGGIAVSSRLSRQTDPRLVYDNMGGVIAAWRDRQNQSSQLRVQRIDFSGNRLWGPEGLLITSPMGGNDPPMIAPLGSGDAVLAWSGGDGGYQKVFLQRAGPTAELLWKQPWIAPAAQPTNQWNPVLYADGEGGAWLAWEDRRNNQTLQVYLLHLPRDGAPAGNVSEMAVAPQGTGDQGKIAMTGDGARGVWIAWIDNRAATVGLYVQRVEASGTLRLGPAGSKVADRLNRPLKPFFVSTGPGRAALLWADQPKKGQWQLFWRYLSAE